MNNPKKYQIKKQETGTETVYEKLTKLNEELYYRRIVQAHEKDIKDRVQKLVDDIIYQVNKGYLSFKEATKLLEEEKKGVYFIDSILKAAPYRVRTEKKKK